MSMNEFSGPRERKSYRISYPAGYPERLLPRVVLKPDTPVAFKDWSETGVKFQLAEPTALAVRAVVRLTVTPHGSDAIAVEGTIVRVEGAVISVKLKPPALPWKLMLDEQRAILAWQTTRVETIEEAEEKVSKSRRTTDEPS